MAEDKELTIGEHFLELRQRLVWAVGAIIVGTLISVIFSSRALELLVSPLGEQIPQTIKPTEGFTVYFKVALIGGLCLSMPVLVYEAVRFMLPGLLPAERKYLYWLVPGVAVCFVGGVVFAALIMLPAAINFMQSFLREIIDNRWTLEHYISFVTNVLFWMGMVFQTPLILFFLAKIGVVSAKQLAKFRKFAVLVIAVIAAMVTPTPDPVNMGIVMVPLYMLYEVGIILARFADRGKVEEEPLVVESSK